MKATNPMNRNTSASTRALFCLALTSGLAVAGCELRTFSWLEAKALKYGTVSVGAAKITDYNDCQLREARRQLEMALVNLRGELGGGKIMGMYPRNLDRAAETSAASVEPLDAAGGQTPRPSEVELVGMRLAALKLVQSELESLKLDSMSKVEDNFRRVVISLDCSAWVRGEAAAALVYIDLYPFNADSWCHEAAKIMEDWWDEKHESTGCSKPADPARQEKRCYPNEWSALIDSELAGTKFDRAFKPLGKPMREMPDESDIDAERDPEDWVAFCHRQLEDNRLFPHIVHVERTGRAEYLISAESAHSTSGFEISAAHPAGVSGKYSAESSKKSGRRMAAVRPLSLAFVAGDRRAGWLFMPSQAGGGAMLPTERRLKIVVDVPRKLRRLAIHVHKLFLGPDLELLGGATLASQADKLKQTRQVLTDADRLDEGMDPKHYRLMKTRMRNLLYQGWAEEIVVDIPSE